MRNRYITSQHGVITHDRNLHLHNFIARWTCNKETYCDEYENSCVLPWRWRFQVAPKRLHVTSQNAAIFPEVTKNHELQSYSMHRRALQYRRPLAARCAVPVFGGTPNCLENSDTSLDCQTVNFCFGAKFIAIYLAFSYRHMGQRD